jgi:cobalt-zinc-cadmium efflux system outer membrane protein
MDSIDFVQLSQGEMKLLQAIDAIQTIPSGAGHFLTTGRRSFWISRVLMATLHLEFCCGQFGHPLSRPPPAEGMKGQVWTDPILIGAVDGITLVRIKFWKMVSAAMAVGTLLAGCVRFKPQPLSSAQVVADYGARSLDNPELKEFLEGNVRHESFAWPLPSWDLTKLVLAAFFYHPDLDVARARWAVVQAGKKIAAERPNPTISVNPAYDTTTLIPSPWVVTASLDIPIETAGKRGYRVAQATQLSEAARLNIASVAWVVRSRVRQRLVELYTARETEVLLNEQHSIQMENLRLLENQYQAGAVSAFEVTQARIAADSTRLALRDTERQSAEARVQLADAIGVHVRALEGVTLSFAALNELPVDIPADEARRQALLNRADILGALAEYAASQSALQLEIARQYPDVHLSPGYEFDQGDNKWSLGPSVTLPVFNQNKGAIAEAAAKRAEAAANFNALQAGVVAEIERAAAGYRVALQKKDDTDALRTNLLKQERTAQAMLDAGEISKAELSALRLQLNAAALARLDALTKSQQALGALEDALQNPIGVPTSAWQTSPRLSDTRKLAPQP